MKIQRAILVVLCIGIVGAVFWKKSDFRFRRWAYRGPLPSLSHLPQEIAFYEARVRAHPESFLDQAILANLYWRLGRRKGDKAWIEKADEMAERSLKVWREGNVDAEMVRIKVLQYHHRFDEADRRLSEIIKANPTLVSAWLLKGYGALAKNDLKSAEEAARKAITLDRWSSSYLLKALVDEAQGKTDSAREGFERVVRAENFVDAEEAARGRAYFARFLGRQGDRDLAQFLIAEAQRLAPQEPLVLAVKDQIRLARGPIRNTLVHK